MIYFDNNSTTRPLAEVVEAMLPFLREQYGNPSSTHQFGQGVRHRVELAREQVAALVGASPKEILFTGGGTESIQLAVRGVLAARPGKRRIVATAVEHSALLSLLEALSAEGYEVDLVGVDKEGRIDEAEWAAKCTEETGLASLIHVNNETGVTWDIARLAAIADGRGVPVHVDAVQSAGKLPIRVEEWPVRLVSITGHKFHGPKGVGALYVRRRTRLVPIFPGTHERGLRAGTENVPGIVGMGAAAVVVANQLETTAAEVGALRDRLEQGILAGFAEASVNGAGAERIFNTTNIAFPGLEAEAILILLSEAGICASSGSACSSGSLEPSHVLTAMGTPEAAAHGSIRFSLSRFNTNAEVDEVVGRLPKLLAPLTALTR